MEPFMQHQGTDDFYDLTQDFLWGLENKWDIISLKKSIMQISNKLSFEIDWDEGIENWIALHGQKNTDFILLSSLIPFAFVHNSLYSYFIEMTDIKVYFFDDYQSDMVFLSKDIMKTCFKTPEEYYDFNKSHTLSDFIYTTYT